jgi:uncharacterized membrane protein YhhN
MRKSNRIGLDLLFPLFACIYLASLVYSPYFLQPFWKALPIMILAFLVFRKVRGNRGADPATFLFGCGLVLSSLGDITLAIDFSHSFVMGLGFFLIAHIFYSFGFWKLNRSGFSLGNPKLGLVLGLGLVMGLIIIPLTGNLFLPVGLYILVIVSMASLASVQESSAFLFFWGALVFMISDGIIAVNQFVNPIPYSGFLIMFTYYLAQWLLARGILDRDRSKISPQEPR